MTPSQRDICYQALVLAVTALALVVVVWWVR